MATTATATAFKKREGKKDASQEKRPKRFKVGRACYSCRLKKIKCNGIQPCMQCTARQLSCTFSVDGSMDNDALGLSELSDTDTSSTPLLAATNGDHQPQEGKQAQPTRSQPLVLEDAINILDSLGGTTWLDKGNKGHWYIDELQLLEGPTLNDPPSLLASPSPSTTITANHHKAPTMPSRKMQRQLIQTYYQHHYPLFHTIPRDLFLQHFDNPGVSISPMLLLAIFAHGAQHDASDGGAKANDYFDQAKELLNGVLDIPCLSTVVALCLLSLYEPKLGADYRSRSTSYSALAFRMCDELGYGQLTSRSCGSGGGGGGSNSSSDNGGDQDGEMELQKRVAWGCYCLDKMQGTYLGSSWMMRLEDMNVDLPRCYWPNEDQEQMECFVAFIKLMQMTEQSLKPHQFMKYPSGGGHMDIALTHRLDQDLFHWLQALPLHLHWTPLHTPHPSSSTTPSSTSASTPPPGMTIPSHPPRNAWIAHLHLLFNFIKLRVLLPFASPSSADKLLHQRCMSVATHLIQLPWFMTKQSDFIISYALTGTAIMTATRSHFMNCGHQDGALAWHARYMFQRGIQSLSILVQQEQRLIPGMDAFLVRVKGALDRVDTTANGTSFLLTPPNGNDTISTNHMHLTGSEQNAAEVLSHAFDASSIWQPAMDNSHEHHYQQHLHEMSSHHMPTTKPTTADPLDFLGPTTANPTGTTTTTTTTTSTATTETTAILEDSWNHRMAPSSVDALLYKSQQEFASGGLLMSHAKLNDPFLLSSWMMRHSKDLMTTPPSSDTTISTHQPIPPPMATVADDSLFWPQLPLETPPPTATPTATAASTSSSSFSLKQPTSSAAAIGMPGRSYGQYMNIGLGVYASAHQHHNDVIRQHIPDTPGRKASRPVILTHQGQVIVTPPDNNAAAAASDDANANGGALMG